MSTDVPKPDPTAGLAPDDSSVPPARRAEIALSPFYHSAVNAVTEPARFVACSHYFVTRWMPLLGGEGARIVLALRSLGYYNPKTGERRDQIVVGHAELAARVGCSEDTLTRQLGLDKRTGRPRNPALAAFVERERRVRRDPYTGRVWQEQNAFRVAMDDPIHPDDWSLVVDKVAEREAQRAGGKTPIPLQPRLAARRDAPQTGNGASAPPAGPPGPRNAVPGGPPGPPSAGNGPQTPGRSPQIAGGSPQIAVKASQTAVPHKGNLYSALPEPTRLTPARREGSIDSRMDSEGPKAGGAPRLPAGQTGFAAFREAVSQLRAQEPKRRGGRYRQKGSPAERPEPASEEGEGHVRLGE